MRRWSSSGLLTLQVELVELSETAMFYSER